MIKEIYTIYDHKLKVFLTPMFAHNEEEAKRIILEIASDPKTNLNKYPHDFSLMKIGEFDDYQGIVNPLQPENIGSANFIVNSLERERMLKDREHSNFEEETEKFNKSLEKE